MIRADARRRLTQDERVGRADRAKRIPKLLTLQLRIPKLLTLQLWYRDTRSMSVAA